MSGPARISRRALLRRGALGAAGFALTGARGELLTGALASASGEILTRALARAATAPPPAPSWRSRPDLRIPALAVVRSEAGASEDPIFLAPYDAPAPAQAGAVIADSSGEAIWENPIAGKVTTNFQVQYYRGAPVLTWWQGNIRLGHGVGEYVIADTSYRIVRRVQAGHGLMGDLHEFVITPQGTALYTSYAVLPYDLSRLGGPSNGTIQDSIFQEQDLASGRILHEWHSLDHVALEESYWPVGANWDYFHLNSISTDYDGNLLISARNTWTIYKVNRRSGAIMWRLGGRRSDFEVGPGAHFFWQHDARRRGANELTVFDNGAYPVIEPRSRALILAVDEASRSARLVSQYTHPGVLAASQGDVQLLASGNVFVGWGEVGRVSEFRRSGQLVFDAILGERYESYRAFRLPWSAHPAEAPALAVVGTASGAATAYASWNGASNVAAWRLLAGAGASALAPAATVRASGFETALGAAPGSGPVYLAEALDAHGNVLGRSAAVSA